MMKPTIEQVLDYLESGKSNLGLEDYVRNDPDGRAMLVEAQRLHELLLREALEDPDDDREADAESLRADESTAEIQVVRDAVGAYDMGADMTDDDFPEVNIKSVMAAGQVARKAAGRVLNLGDLSIRQEKSGLALEFQPSWNLQEHLRGSRRFPSEFISKRELPRKPTSKSGMGPAGSDYLAALSGRTADGDIMIGGLGIGIIAPSRLPAQQSIPLRVMNLDLDEPASDLQLVLMPESGPFIKITTDSNGVAELPIPNQPTILRIETEKPQLVNIRLFS